MGASSSSRCAWEISSIRSCGLPAFSFPKAPGRQALTAGFGQIEAKVIKVGMVAEATCISRPWTIIPMVVTQRAGLHRGGPVPRRRATDRSAAGACAPGTILAFVEPIYKGGLDGVTPGSSCVVNAYTSNHDRIAAKDTGAFKGFCAACGRRRRPRARDAAPHPGAAAAGQDAGAERALILLEFRNGPRSFGGRP